MAYIGSTPTSQNFISGTDYFNGTGSQTAFTLTRAVNSVNDVEVVVNNVIQQPNSYTISGTTLTLSAAPSSGTSNVYVRYLATNQQSFTVGNNTVGYNQLTTDMQSKFAMKNRIINGAMVIDQRNAGASGTATGYNLDRWVYTASQTSKFTWQQNAGSVTPPVGFTNYLGYTSSSAYSITATDYFLIDQYIEGYNIADLGWGTANAKTVTVSFWVRSSLTGTFGGVLQNEDLNRTYPFTYTISSANTWEQKSVTVAGDTSGTWLTTNGRGIRIRFNLGTGSTYSATAGSWTSSLVFAPTGATSVVGTNGATFYITGVQLEVGSSATGFEYRQYGTELSLCQRYYEYLTVGANESFVMQAVSTTQARGGWNFAVTKRDAPTMSTSGTVNAVNATAGTGFATTVTYYSPNINNTSVFVNAVSGTPLVAGNASNLYSSSGSAKLIASAEL